MTKKLILCDCEGSQSIDVTAITANCDITCSKTYSQLCTHQMSDAAAEIAEGNTIIACQQERPLFEELAAEVEVETPGFIDLRDRAGWTKGDTKPAQTSAKMSALVSDFLLPRPATKIRDVYSEGRCLIIGEPEAALSAALRLTEELSVTVLLNDQADIPLDRAFEVVIGQLTNASGTFGNFSVSIDALQQLIPGGRGDFKMDEPKDGGTTQCDIIIDLSGKTPLFPAPQKRDGYLHCDPKDALAIAKTIAEATNFVGTFEKSIFLKFQEHLCAHSRANITGCTKCLDVCPTSAISPNGDHVEIDPMICAGCGSCVALCPSGAITYDSPPTSFLFQRIKNLAEIYQKIQKSPPKLLVCDTIFAPEMISLAARFDDGLPTDVIPLEVDALSNFGHAEMLAALACGFSHVDILLSPKTERETLVSECEIANTIANKANVTLLDISDPSELSRCLFAEREAITPPDPILPLGNRRQIARLSAAALRDKDADPIRLPPNAPYGAVVVDTDACTLCLSCVSLCPTGALGDNPDTPQLRFQEDACIQCGLCTHICPENALSLLPQLDLSDRALSQRVINEEEPFPCVECGALFGVKSTVEKISKKLAGKHSMFASEDTARLIQMCENCRVEVQYKNTDNPFQGGERPKTVTTDDYLKGDVPDLDYLGKRKDH